MPFKVKATLIGFLGNTERYPCHFNHKVGDEVILLGAGITAEDLAEWAGTNEYEVMTNISARVPRVFV